MRKAIQVLALFLLPLFLNGCWSYRNLKDVSIGMGMGLDEDPATGGYQVTSEIVDFTKSAKEGPSGKLVESTGQTIFEALRDSKRKLNNKLYFSNAQIVVFSEAVARNKGLLEAADWIMRDKEGRETLNLLVAKGGTAHDLLATKGLDQSMISLEIDSVINEDSQITSSTAHTELYTAYDILNSPGSIELTLPAFIVVDSEGQKVAEADGIAAFKGDKLVGYLSKEESKFFLIATNQCHGGILVMDIHGTGEPDVSLEIEESMETTSFEAKGDSLSFRVQTETNVYLSETLENIDVLKDDQIKALETEAGKRLEVEIAALIEKVQREMGTDIFGFGNLVHQRDPKLWHSMQSRWGEIFPTLPVSVSCKVNIVNTAFITSKEAIHP